MTDFVSVTVQDTAPIAVTVPTDDGTTVAVTVSTPAVIAPVVTTGGSGGGTGGAVSSVNGQTGDVVLTAASVGAATAGDVSTAIATAEAASDSAGTAAADVATLAATLAPVATSGDYNDLTDLPTLGSASTHDAADFVAIADAAPIDTTAADIQPTTTGSASAGSTAKAADAGHAHKIGGHASTHAPTGSDDLTTALSATSPPVALADVATVGSGTGFSRQGHVHPNTGLVKSTDNRLTDARTPTAHASTHGSAGSDPVSIASTQVTGLGTAATANKVAAGSAGVLDATDATTTNARTPTAHAPTHAPGGTDDLTTALSATSAPVALAATAAVGSGTGFSRQGHVHPTTGLVLTGDSRLSDSRTPTAHASTHASGGTDALTLAESQVTGLVTDLATNRRRAAPNLLRTGAIAETFDRRYINNAALTSGTGTLRCAAIQLIAGDVVSNVVVGVGTTAAVTPTHSYGALLDSAGNVLGVSTDKTTTAVPASAEFTFAMTSPVTIATSGLYYIGASFSAGTVPSLLGGGLNSYAAALAPALNVIASQATPPTVGAALTLTASSGLILWGFVS